MGRPAKSAVTRGCWIAAVLSAVWAALAGWALCSFFGAVLGSKLYDAYNTGWDLSADGQTLYFSGYSRTMRRRSGGVDFDVYQLNLTNHKVAPVVTGPADDRLLSVAPNEQAFLLLRQGDLACSNSVWLAPRNGTPRCLASASEAAIENRYAAVMGGAEWSPDGRFVSLAIHYGDHSAVRLVEVRGRRRDLRVQPGPGIDAPLSRWVRRGPDRGLLWLTGPQWSGWLVDPDHPDQRRPGHGPPYPAGDLTPDGRLRLVREGPVGDLHHRVWLVDTAGARCSPVVVGITGQSNEVRPAPAGDDLIRAQVDADSDGFEITFIGFDGRLRCLAHTRLFTDPWRYREPPPSRVGDPGHGCYLTLEDPR